MAAVRTMVHIDEGLCDGCGLCVPGCAEGALQIVDGKAKLVSDIYCDGLGACLGECPQGAITMIEREAEGFDEEAVHEHLAKLSASGKPEEQISEERNEAEKPIQGCPGSLSQFFEKEESVDSGAPDEAGNISSRLENWPVQISLVPPEAPYFDGANILIAADCVPFAYADFHREMLDGKVVMIGCPKLDDTDFYLEKLTQIFGSNNISSVEVVFMEVPCCGGLVQVVRNALAQSGRDIESIFTRIGIKGDLLERRTAGNRGGEDTSAGTPARP